MEEAAIALAKNPWAFLVLAILTTVSAIRPLIEISKFTFRYLSNVGKSGLSASGAFIKILFAENVLKIADSKNPSGEILSISLFSIFLLGQCLVMGIFIVMLFSSSLFEISQTNLSTPEVDSKLSEAQTYLYLPIMIFFLNLAVWQAHFAFSFRSIQLYLRSDAAALDRYRTIKGA